MPKFTPGPWLIKSEIDYKPPEMSVCHIIENDVPDDHHDAKHIAFAFGGNDNEFSDANLLAAAPELYAALAAIVRSDGGQSEESFAIGRTALDKADGKIVLPLKEKQMDIKQFAAMLDGRQYRKEMSSSEEENAKRLGFIVVFGASDDLIELRGAIYDEVGVNEGGEVRLDERGEMIPEIEGGDEIEVLKKFGVFDDVKAKRDTARKIEAVWDEGGYSWTYRTDIPHATFEILEDGYKYCRGIVFEKWW